MINVTVVSKLLKQDNIGDFIVAMEPNTLGIYYVWTKKKPSHDILIQLNNEGVDLNHMLVWEPLHQPIKQTSKKGIKNMREHYLLQFFKYKHLPENLQAKSKPFHDLAKNVIKTTPVNAEQTTCLRKLLEAKDCAVRAMIFKVVEKQ